MLSQNYGDDDDDEATESDDDSQVQSEISEAEQSDNESEAEQNIRYFDTSSFCNNLFECSCSVLFIMYSLSCIYLLNHISYKLIY